MAAYSCDFETTTDENDCRVWAWAACSIDEAFTVEDGNSIDTFMSWCYHHSGDTVYFHNEKFDGEFILAWLLTHGFSHITDKHDIATSTFETLITDTGVFYSMKIYFEVKGKRKSAITIWDSLKVLPMPVSQVSKAFGVPETKLEIDYNEYRPIGHILTDKEREYIRNDVVIIAKALYQLFSQGLTKMTTASNAMNDFKKRVGGKTFDKWFPTPEYDKFVRLAYRGGFTYLQKGMSGKEIGAGIRLDVNSLYPYVMYAKRLPYGEPIWFEGQYIRDDVYPLCIQAFTCEFELKPDHIPTIQIKNSRFNDTDYLETSDGPVELVMTNVDIKLMLDHYNVSNVEFHGGWKFKATDKAFRDYVSYWVAIKNQATIDGNKGLRQIAKLMLNSLYGKFALNPATQSKIPFLGEDGIVHYRLGEKGERKLIYSPVAIFVTAWARDKTIRAAQSVYDRFVYADTDSLHLIGLDIPKHLDIDDVKLGAWKNEGDFVRAKFIRAKSYIEEMNLGPMPILTEGEGGKHVKKVQKLLGMREETGVFDAETQAAIAKFQGNHGLNITGALNHETWERMALEVTCAGMMKSVHARVTFDNFSVGFEATQLKPRRVRGGIVLRETPFEIKP